MTAEGPRKGEPSTKTMRYSPQAQPALSVRGSSRRIMSLRFRPAHISVINRRPSLPAVIGTAAGRFFLSLCQPSIRGKRDLSRIHVVARRASLTAPVFHQSCSAYQSERKNRLIPRQSVGLDKVAPYQFSEGLSIESTTTISTGPRVDSSFRPSCCWKAVKRSGRASASLGGRGTALGMFVKRIDGSGV